MALPRLLSQFHDLRLRYYRSWAAHSLPLSRDWLLGDRVLIFVLLSVDGLFVWCYCPQVHIKKNGLSHYYALVVNFFAYHHDHLFLCTVNDSSGDSYVFYIGAVLLFGSNS